jgi:hypothetical protein
MIRVIYKNGDEDLVSPKFLDILLFIDEVEKFQRADGWVSVANGRLRSQTLGSYTGAERRRHSQTVLQPFAMKNRSGSEAVASLNKDA